MSYQEELDELRSMWNAFPRQSVAEAVYAQLPDVRERQLTGNLVRDDYIYFTGDGPSAKDGVLDWMSDEGLLDWVSVENRGDCRE